VPDAQWIKTVPGVYQGSQANLREVVTLAPTGTFRHEVFIAGKSACVESGRWTYEKGAVIVEPFTSFYDKNVGKAVTNGSEHRSDALFVMRYGREAERISPSINYDYCLYKIKPQEAGTNGTNKNVGASAQ
jgi:hypothetical protein